MDVEYVDSEYLLALDRALLEANVKSFKRTGKSVFAVARGRQVGLFNTWDECEKSVKGFQGAVFKKFENTEDASRWLLGMTLPKATEEMVDVYVDGSCLHNQTPGLATAGVGVWFGENDPRNVSERLVGKQTNQRAEIVAVIRALEAAPLEPLCVYTDSEYCVSGVNFRLQDWAAHNFHGVDNADLWERLHQMLRARTAPVFLKHVKGHSGIVGNECANLLAIAGARRKE